MGNNETARILFNKIMKEEYSMETRIKKNIRSTLIHSLYNLVSYSHDPDLVKQMSEELLNL